MIYYEQNPECLQKYQFLGVLKQPEVNKMYTMKILFHPFYFDQVIEFPKQEISKVSFLMNNDEIGVETYNMFECLQDEEIVETNFGSEKDNIDGSQQKEANSKGEKKKIKNGQRKKINRKRGKVQKKSPIKRKKTIREIVVKRCHGCHVDHFPLPKFCRWWEKRRSVREVSLHETEQLNDEKMLLVKKCIKMLEDKLNGNTLYTREELVDNFFQRSEASC